MSIKEQIQAAGNTVLSAINLDTFAEELLDVVLKRYRSSSNHRHFLYPAEVQRIRQSYKETKSLSQTARNLRLPRFAIEKVITQKDRKGNNIKFD